MELKFLGASVPAAIGYKRWPPERKQHATVSGRRLTTLSGQASFLVFSLYKVHETMFHVRF
jgi:hypothetical protein